MKKIILFIPVLFLLISFCSTGNQPSEINDKTDKKILNWLDKDNFNSSYEKGIVLVDFWAVWCGPCKIQDPIFKEAAIELEHKASFFKVDVDKSPSIAEKFNISSIPTLIIFKDKKIIKTFVGVTTKESIIDAVENIKI